MHTCCPSLAHIFSQIKEIKKWNKTGLTKSFACPIRILQKCQSSTYKYLMTSKLNIQEFTLEADDSGILQEFLIL